MESGRDSTTSSGGRQHASTLSPLSSANPTVGVCGVECEECSWTIKMMAFNIFVYLRCSVCLRMTREVSPKVEAKQCQPEGKWEFSTFFKCLAFVLLLWLLSVMRLPFLLRLSLFLVSFLFLVSCLLSVVCCRFFVIMVMTSCSRGYCLLFWSWFAESGHVHCQAQFTPSNKVQNFFSILRPRFFLQNIPVLTLSCRFN